MAVHGVHATLISGQRNSGEMVLAAAAFLCGHYRAASLISTNKNIRPELFLSLDTCRIRGCFVRDPATYYAEIQQKDILYPSEYVHRPETFWLALDEQGYSLAKEIFLRIGVAHDEQIHNSVRRLNLVELAMPIYPEVDTSPAFWKHILHELAEAYWAHRRIRSKKNLRALYDKLVPVTSEETKFCSWYKSLHDSLIPWLETMESMISYL